MPSYESSMENLAKARRKFRPPRPWRSNEEAQMIRRYVFWWLTCRDATRPSGRAWAKQLGVSHTWLQKLVRQFQSNPSELGGLQARKGDPKFADLARAREYTEQMRERCELRSRRASRGSEID